MNESDPRRHGYRGVIFDLDGTLLDTLPDIAQAMNDVLAGRGLPPHPLAAYRHFVGNGARMLVLRAVPGEVRSTAAVEEVLADFVDRYRGRAHAATQPFEGIVALLDALGAAAIPWAVLSNKPDDLTGSCVARFLPQAGLTAVYGHRPDLPLKPDATGAFLAARSLGLPPGAVVFVGDSGVDMQTAGAAGMLAAGALWGYRGAVELLQAGAAVLLRKPADLLPFLERVVPSA